MKQLISSWQMLFSVLFIISVALLIRLCAKYFNKHCRRIGRQRKSGTEEVIFPLQYSSETTTTTTSVLHEYPSDHILLPSLIPPPTTISEVEHGEQRTQEEEEEEIMLAENNVCFQDLPSDVLLHIISFLPLATIGPLVKVCKSWSDVLRDPRNMDLVLGRKPLGRPNHNPIYLLAQDDFERHLTDLYLLDSMRTSTYHFSKLNVEKQTFISATCSGFICCYHEFKLREYFLCNPLTQEYVKLPEPPKRPNKVYAVFGLGIDLTCKRQSKLVRMFYNDIECDVYTFGSNSWRSLEATNFVGVSDGVLYNWKLYWMVHANPSSSIAPILVFDLETEKFSLISPPNTNVGQKLRFSYVTKLGEELCYVHKYKGGTTIHVLEDDVTMAWSVRYCFTSMMWDSRTLDFHGAWSNDALFVYRFHHMFCCDTNGMEYQQIFVSGEWLHKSDCVHVVGQFFPNLISPKLFWS